MNKPRESTSYSLRGLLIFWRDVEARKVAIVATSAALFLTFCQYFSITKNGYFFFDNYTKYITYFMGFDNLHRLSFWALMVGICYFVLPALVVKLVLRDKLENYGLARKGLLKGLKTYGVLYLFMLPLIILFSYNPHFQSTYPFYKVALGNFNWGRFLTWELLYLFQFLGVEFFFRGFLLHGMKKTAGHLAISAMVLPYCMIHFGKPMPEAIGSIVAGYVLGYLSLKSNNIFPGMILHFAVAIIMDLLSLWHQGLIF